MVCMHYSNLRRGAELKRGDVEFYGVYCNGCGEILRETENVDEYQWWLHATTAEIAHHNH